MRSAFITSEFATDDYFSDGLANGVHHCAKVNACRLFPIQARAGRMQKRSDRI